MRVAVVVVWGLRLRSELDDGDARRGEVEKSAAGWRSAL